jgi:AbrB family looped-hinge helix DNA binding protein
METLATTRMSSRGQVVIPEKVRNLLGFKAGTEFVVVGDGDLIVLKAVRQPTKTEYAKLAKRADSQAKSALAKAIDLVTSNPRMLMRK